MNKTLGKFIFWGSITAITIGGVLALKKYLSNKALASDGNTTSGTTSVDPLVNFNSLLVNLGNLKAVDNGIVIPFNNNSQSANFFTNNRVAIYKGTDLLSKGTYSDGGKTISIDGGKTISGSSVYSNLELLAS